MRLAAALIAGFVAASAGCSTDPDFAHTFSSYEPCLNTERCVLVNAVDLGITNRFQVVSVVEDADTIRIEIRALPFQGEDFGLASVQVDLEDPLGDRIVIDANTGDPVPLDPDV